jgi:hypothetical protein
MKHSFVLLIFFGISLSFPVTAQTMLTGQVVDILGGDNLLVRLSTGELVNVDLVYIRPFISSQPFAEQAAVQYLQTLLPPGTWVNLDPAWVGADGIQFAYVYANGKLINAEMLRAGVSEAPWPIPNPAIREAYENATASLQTATIYGGIQPNFLPRPTPSIPFLGVAVALLLATALVGQLVRKWPGSQTVNLKKQLQTTQQALTSVLTTQKRLEIEYQQAYEQAELWLEKAKLALINEDESLAREALLRKKSYLEVARRLKAALDETSTQVATLKTTLNHFLQAEKVIAQARKELL